MVIIKNSGQEYFFYYSVPQSGIILTKHITYGAWFRAIQKAGRDMDLDPRLVALVQFMARRAAERDYDEARSAPSSIKETEDIPTKD